MAYNYMTKEGYDKLKGTLEELKSTGRAEAAKAIAEAREKGDLSENAEYDAAKDAARILDESQLDTSKVTVLSNVRLLNKKVNKEITYKLVSKAEANLKEKKISVDSPIGKGLLGKAVGDEVVIDIPSGQITFEILEISLG